MISTLADSKEEWNAYVESFETQTLLAELQNDRLIRHLRDCIRGFALLVKCGEENWIECCEAEAGIAKSKYPMRIRLEIFGVTMIRKDIIPWKIL